MMGFKLTIVLTPNGWVVLAQNFIITLGPMATTNPIFSRYPGFLSVAQ